MTPDILTLFPTRIYRDMLAGAEDLNAEIEAAAWSFAEDDEAGRAWCERNRYPGYTSYGTPGDLTERAPAFRMLAKALDRHVAAFADASGFDLGGRKLKRDSLWINLLYPGGFHSGHIHPHSVVSGTYYAVVPDGASALRIEDPRHPLMMAAPTRRPEADQPFVYLAPSAGMVLLWESWLRHEVVVNEADAPRISVSFNYRLP